MTDEAAGPAHVHVVRGAPDEIELAALVAGLAAAGATEGTAGDPPDVRSAWNDRRRAVRGPAPTPGAGADVWRWSLRG